MTHSDYENDLGNDSEFDNGRTLDSDSSQDGYSPQGVHTSSSEPSFPIPLDESLPGPLYGLPETGIDVHHLSAPLSGQEEIADRAAHRQHFELQLVSLRAKWNAHLPIHTLPAEILLGIFKCLLGPYTIPTVIGTQKMPDRPWALLMGVCRHWCALIRSDPAFWSTIDVYGNPSSWSRLALHRSRRSPLTVVLARGCNMPVVVRLLSGHIDHIASLRIHTSHADIIEPLFGGFLPLLHKLSVTIDSPDGSRTSLRATEFVPDVCPHLETLILTHVSLPWTNPILANLKTLILRDCKLSTQPISLAEFLDVLEHGQRLQNLQLDYFLSAAVSTCNSSPLERAVSLPELSFLECWDTSVHIGRLVPHLRTRTACDFELNAECGDANDPSTTYASVVPPSQNGAHVAYVTHPATSVRLIVASTENVLRWDLSTGGSCRLELNGNLSTLWDAWLERGLRQLPAFFPFGRTRLTSLAIEGSLSAVSLATWELIFDSFPMLQTVELDSTYRTAFPKHVLQSLSAPIAAPAAGSAGEDGPSIRCAALAEVALRMQGWTWTRDAVDSVIAWLHARAARGAPKLERLRLSSGFDGVMVREQPEGVWEGYQQRLRESVVNLAAW